MNINRSHLHPEITDFIRHFLQENDEVQASFLYGNCYWFAKILEQRFERQYHCGGLYYNQVCNHFAVCLEGELFDALGILGPNTKPGWVPWWHYKIVEPSDSYRVVRDCVLKTTDSQIQESRLRLLQLY